MKSRWQPKKSNLKKRERERERILPLLEVQYLDAKRIHYSKENSERNQNYSYWSHKIQVITKMVLYIPFDAWIWLNPRHLNSVLHIAILRNY
ncbi:hypothetical protein LguiA_028707 [Lonicera macranthoides]